MTLMKSLATIHPAELTAEAILEIPEAQPEQLFEPDEIAIKRRYRDLVSIWHSDLRPSDARAVHVLRQINMLHAAAKQKLASGFWELPGELKLIEKDTGKRSTLKYAKKHDFELGEMYISQSLVTYAVKKDYADLFENARSALRTLEYGNDKMRAEFTRSMPSVHAVIETAVRYIMVVKKDPNLVLLADLQQHLGGRIEPRHVAWIVSRLHNVACFLEFNGIAHNGISANTFFVAPEDHSGALLGGWWYAARAGSLMKGLSNDTVDVMPPEVIRTGVADTRADLMLIRALGRTLLGDKLGMSLSRDRSVPQPLADWLTLPPTDSAKSDFEAWSYRVLPASFGPRKFVEMKTRFNKIYPSI
jgi:hypothetical protein